MERGLILRLFYMGLLSAAVSVLLSSLVYHRLFRAEAEETLAEECRVLAVSCAGMEDAAALSEYVSDDLYITLTAPDGTVLFDSVQTEAELYSKSLTLADGSVLTVSEPAGSIFSAFERAIPAMILLLAGIAGVSSALSLTLTRKLLAPIRKIPEMIDKPILPAEMAETYPELLPLVEELRRQRDGQEAVRQEFTANVSHELKTPLTTISGFAELIESGMAQGEDAVQFAGRIRSEAERMQTLVSDIIKLSRLDALGEHPMQDTADLREIAEECRAHLAQAAAKQSILITVSGEAEPIRGSRTELYELVYNLMNNAIQYNRTGGNVDVILSGRRLTVADTGIGIPEAHIPRIFERFYRVDKSRSRATGGTGLGLSIVLHAAEHHHADITVHSTEHVGTEFIIDFGKDVS